MVDYNGEFSFCENYDRNHNGNYFSHGMQRWMKTHKNWVRFATVVLYVFAITFPAIALLCYYTFVWDMTA
ncbi:unnamed protein product [Clavelina lepadiformis]|uniref:Uncharacterized protein n=1 Tax=Clavelina lepadiformis TaxID=159417 RepID=A0ABP0FZX0_CLALP